MRLKPKSSQYLAFSLLWLTALTTIACLVLIVGFILKEGLPLVNWEFLSTAPYSMGRKGGIFPSIFASLYLMVFSMVLAAPIGLGTAIYLTEYTRESRITAYIRFGIETLAGIPSIIYGLFGLAFLVTFCKLGFSILSGAITLALMLLPTIIRTSEEAIKAVPRSYREGSLALGATPWTTIIKVVIPAAFPGILTGIMLGAGRAIGETAAVWLTVGGSSLGIPISPLDPGRPLTLHLYTLSMEGISLPRAYATASVLIIIIWMINALANRLLSRFASNLQT